VASAPNIMVVTPSLAGQNREEFIDYAKPIRDRYVRLVAASVPRRISPGRNINLSSSTKIDMVHVPIAARRRPIPI